MTPSFGHYGNGHAGDITRKRVTGSCASILGDAETVRGGSSARRASQVQRRKRSGSSALRMCRFGDTQRFRGTRTLTIPSGTRTSRNVLGVAPVPAEVRPLRPGIVCSRFWVLGVPPLPRGSYRFRVSSDRRSEGLEPYEGELSRTVLRGL